MGLLALAGSISGAGKAAERGLGNFQAALTTQMLQKGSQDFIRERDETANTRAQFNIQEERAYTERLLSESRAYTEGAPRRAMDTAEALQPRSSALAARTFEQEKPTRDAAAKEDIVNEVTKATLLAENKAWLKAQTILSSTKESSASKAQAAKTMFELERGQRGAKLQDDFLALEADPQADPAQVSQARAAWSSFSTKPGESEKIDASHASAGLKEAGNEIVRLQSMMSLQMPGTPEYVAITRRLQNAEYAHDAYDARLRELTGAKSNPAESLQTDLSKLDPWQTSPLRKTTSPNPAKNTGLLTTPTTSTMRPRTLDEAVEEAGGSVNLPRASASGPRLEEVRAYIDAQGTAQEGRVRDAYLKKYRNPPTQALLSQLMREAKGGG